MVLHGRFPYLSYPRHYGKRDYEIARQALEQVGAAKYENHSVGDLSGGQRQAVTLLMATLRKPKILLLDEHTAALDPKTAAKVLQLTDKLVSESNLTTLMITHNMHDAIAHGNRLIMMHEGNVAVDVRGEEKSKLTIQQLLDLFEQASGSKFGNDAALLSTKR